MAITVDVKSKKDEVIRAKNEALARAFEAIGLTAEALAKVECPVDTGNLRNSISHETNESAAVIGTNVEYAPYVEMGTAHQTAQPYLRPAIENNISQYKMLLEQALKV